MNAFSLRAYGRVLWHEAAERYTFCIGIFALLITMQVSVATMDSFDIIPPPEIAFGFGMTLFMTAIYAAASCALLLTADVDAGTFVFHRTKPVGWFSYLGGKLSWVVLSSLLLGLLGWIETGVWLGSFPNAREASFAFGVTGVGILEGLAWGLIASMLFREPLRAVIAGIAMASVAAYVTVVLHHTATGGGTVAVTAAYSRAAWPRLAVAAAVLATGLPLARVWYRTGQPLRPWALPRFLRGEARPAAVAGGWDVLPRPRRGRAIRLVWHAWRQIRTPVLVYWGVYLATWAVAGLYHLFHEGDSRVSGEDLLAITSAVLVTFSPLLAGYTFGADQKARFLQLARDGVSPWEIWLSRLAVMAAALLPAAVVVFASAWFTISPSELPALKPLVVLLVVLGYVSVLVIGQACSMFVRSRIVALLAAPVMTACFAFWIAMGVLLGLEWKLGAAPMLLALLIGSRLLAGSRLRQDNSWRATRVPALLIVAAVAFTFLAFAHHRTTEIRPYDSVTKVDLRLMNLPPITVVKNSSRRPADWRKGLAPGQWTEWMEQALQTRGDTASRTSADVIRIPWRGNSSAVFRKTYAEMLMADAQLYWALRKVTSRPGIGNEQLRVCLDFLENWAAERPRHAQWLATDCQRDISWLQYGPTEGYAEYGFHDEPLPWRYRHLPFERTRALQLLDRAYRIAADRAEEYETAVLNDQIGIRPYGGYGRGLVTSEDILPYDPSRLLWYQMSHERFLETGMHRFRLLRSLMKMHWSQADPLYTAESQRRGTILYLALRMYSNDHGQLPDSLDALTQRSYLNRLPVVPIACQRFYYEPRGASEELNAILAKRNADQADRPEPVPFLYEHDPALPFLWCPVLPNQKMDPAAGAGLFIDLDFVK